MTCVIAVLWSNVPSSMEVNAAESLQLREGNECMKEKQIVYVYVFLTGIFLIETMDNFMIGHSVLGWIDFAFLVFITDWLLPTPTK